jgi:hypothetical protein
LVAPDQKGDIMPRIQLAELNNVEVLTPEKLEQILGAGRPSFKPTFDTLEAREVMDAGLGGALSGPTGRPNVDAPPAHVREFRTAAEIPVDYTALGRTAEVQTVVTTAKQDAEFVMNEVARLIEQKLIPQLPSLASAKLVGRANSVHSETHIRLDFQIRYSGHNWGAIGGNTDYIGTISLHCFSTWQGGIKVYKLSHQSLGNFEHSPQMKWETVGHALDAMVANNQVKTNNTFDANKFADGVAKRAESQGRGTRQLGVGGYAVHHIEAFDGGIRIHVKAGTKPGFNYHVYGLVLEFKFDNADVQAGSLKLTNVSSGSWYGGHGWQTGADYSQSALEHAMRKDGDRWNLAG